MPPADTQPTGGLLRGFPVAHRLARPPIDHRGFVFDSKLSPYMGLDTMLRSELQRGGAHRMLLPNLVIFDTTAINGDRRHIRQRRDTLCWHRGEKKI